MSAKIVRATTPERVKLGEVLPLAIPFGVNIFPTNVCNFKCFYCAHSQRPIDYLPQFLEWEDYKKCIDDISRFPGKIKTLLFTGLGEPLMHPNIADMIQYAKKAEVAETTRIITNASLLTKEISDSLIEAGLDSLKISLQGINDKQYCEVCKSPVPFKTIIRNIQYFYEKKKNTIVNVKIMSEMLEGDADKDKLLSIFGNISDIINEEYLQSFPESDDSKFVVDSEKNQSGERNLHCEICPIPFYYYSLYQDGEIVPTCALFWNDYKSISLGNIKDTDMEKVWTGREFNRFRCDHLNGNRGKYKTCAKCEKYISAVCRTEDRLDEYKEVLLKKYNALI